MTDENKPVIVAAFRTPQARKNGYFSEVRGEDLSVAIIDHTLEKTIAAILHPLKGKRKFYEQSLVLMSSKPLAWSQTDLIPICGRTK